MKKKKILKCTLFCFTVVFLMVPQICSADSRDYQVIKSIVAIDTSPRHTWKPYGTYNSVDDEFFVVWRTAGKLRNDCDPDDMYECENSFQSIDAARISPDGKVINITISPPESPKEGVGSKSMPRPAHNPFRNEYMVIYGKSPENCIMCHEGEAVAGNVHPRRCATCHPMGGQGECDLVNLNSHLLNDDPDCEDLRLCGAHCLDCHDYLNDCISSPVAPSEHFADCLECHSIDQLHPRIGHNTYGNEIYETILDSAGNVLTTPESVYSTLTNAVHPVISFNTVRKQYLIIYDEPFLYGNYWNNIGFILDEDGNTVKGPFRADTGDGAHSIYYIEYNPDNDHYMLNWEDWRHADDPSRFYFGPCTIYGCLLDGEGNIVADFPTKEYSGMPDEGRMVWNPFQVYNPDRNEYLVSWVDNRPSLEDRRGVYGRFINADGSFRGEPFVIVDGPKAQGYQEMVYVAKEKKYFMVWADSRDYIPAPDDPQWIAENDIYARWLDDETGLPVGDEIPIYVGEGDQTGPLVEYSPVTDRFLIAWWELTVPTDYEPIPGEGIGSIGPTVEEFGMPQGMPESGDVRGTIYGIPSFLTGHVVEKGTGDPVEGARVLVMGRSLPELKKTNVGGWFNIEKKSQAEGIYLVVVLKLGYRMAFQSVVCAGEPRQVTIEINKWW
ncbi:MAG: hypothetical protein JRJ00_01560 [Deltaproteobacteria bacterium]|nr:hypothetical protein [Deltaproteobacteria bacterium]